MALSHPISAYGLPPSIRSLVERFQESRAKTTADRSLALRLKDAFARQGVPVSGLSVYVNHGAVAVYGTVPNPQSRETIMGLVASQPGVTRIVDHLRLTPTT